MERNKETRKCLKVNIHRAYALSICAEEETERDGGRNFKNCSFAPEPAHMTQETKNK